ncbi:hypothetical protein ACK33O_17985 [Aeromonas hydrophila]|uniref:hypothetical protein n=1 Tax=Aeromonas hydrophila TaxID=644 RepID=UPI0039880D58
MQVIVRIGNRVISAEQVDSLTDTFIKDDIVVWKGQKCVVDYVNQKTISLQLVTYP